jgi:hypothetical protein
MVVIFIDANVYLDFYFAGGQKYRGLLENLKRVGKHVYVTVQVVDEVTRNKLKVFIRDFAGSIQPAKLDLALPPSFDIAPDKEKAVWKGSLTAAQKAMSEVTKEFDTQVTKMAAAIERSTDPVSVSLAPLFKAAEVASADVLSKARLRKELGNPPGKANGTLGDQVSWEQLLATLKAGCRVWLVTKDSDYVIKHGGKVFLNPLLHSEIAEKVGKGGEVHCFDSLVDALVHFAKSNKEITVGKLPSEDVQREINEEIHDASVSAASIAPWGTGVWNAGTWGAATWGQQGTEIPFEAGAARAGMPLLRSDAVFGVHAQMTCKSCGKSVTPERIWQGKRYAAMCPSCGQSPN